MPKTNEQLKEIKEARISQIIGAALKVFCEKGYESTTVDDIVKRVGCSHGLFYHYFDSKKTLFHEVMARKRKVIHDDMISELENVPCCREKLKVIITALFDNMKKDEIFAYRYYFFVSTIFEKAEKNMLSPKSKCPPHVRMFEFFEQGINNGDFSNKYSAKECTRLYNCIIQGATLNFILYPKEFKKDFNFPSIQFIIDVFKKEKNNA